MSRGVNKVFLLGNVGSVDKHGKVVRASLATSSVFQDKATGNKQDVTEWHRLVFFGRLSEIAEKYINKGDKIHVIGTLRYGKYTDAQGSERYTTDVVVKELEMLTPKQDRAESYSKGEAPAPEATSHDDFYDDEIPF